MKNLLLALTALVEAATGIALLVSPAIVIQLLFGAEIAGIGAVVSRLAGIALVALSIACWPGASGGRGLCGMLTYNSLATIYLAYVGLAGGLTGKLLWPAVGVHAILTLLLAWAWSGAQKPQEKPVEAKT